MNKVLRLCKNMSANELINFVCLIRALLVKRLLHGDVSDLAEDQPTLPAFNDLLALLRSYYSESLNGAALDIRKNLVERLV